MNKNIIIDLKNISFAYKADGDEEAVKVFDRFSLCVEDGQCVLVRGDNGSGKTTLFRILNGLSFPDEGEYYFNGTRIDSHYLKDNKASKAFHKEIGYLFQNPDIMLFNARVFDEIAFGPRQMGLSDEEVDRRTLDTMKLFEIESLAGKAPYHLSGGQKKKVALAAVMSLNPSVVILDEPYAGLDSKSKLKLTEYIKKLKATGKTLIIASHETAVDEIADEVVQITMEV